MPRMQVYLPEDLHREVKERGLKASALLQAAIRAELEDLAVEAEADRYLEELTAEVGEGTPEDKAWAAKVVRELLGEREEQAS